MKITPIAKGQGGQITTVQAKTQVSPSMQEKMRAAQAAPPPPAVAASAPPPGAAVPAAPAAVSNPTRTGIVEGQTPGAEATAPAVNPQLAVLARQTRQIRQAQLKLDAEKAAFEARLADYVPKARLKDEPLNVLNEAGLSYDRLTELQLSQADPDPVRMLQAEVANLKAELSKNDTKWSEQTKTRDEQARAQAVQAIQRDAELLVDVNPAYETIKAAGQASEITRLIEKVFDTEGVMLSVEEAANEIETALVERESAYLAKLSALPKIKAKLAPATPVAEEQPTRQPPRGTQPRTEPQTRTLNNGMGVSRPLSARERAMIAFENARLNK